MNGLRAIPTTYQGVQFRSTLEADWACNLDALNIVWQYEPEGVQLPSGEWYLPDFFLPEIETWLEVKGPHDEGLIKTYELAQAVWHSTWCGGECWSGADFQCEWERQLVVIGRPPTSGRLTWELLDSFGNLQDGFFDYCRKCGSWWWGSVEGAFGCRRHRIHGGGDDDHTLSEPPLWVRAPRGGH